MRRDHLIGRIRRRDEPTAHRVAERRAGRKRYPYSSVACRVNSAASAPLALPLSSKGCCGRNCGDSLLSSPGRSLRRPVTGNPRACAGAMRVCTELARLAKSSGVEAQKRMSVNQSSDSRFDQALPPELLAAPLEFEKWSLAQLLVEQQERTPTEPLFHYTGQEAFKEI